MLCRAALDLPCLGDGRPVPALWYADDCVLLATSAAGLQAQLRLLESYCQEWGLTVNLTKTSWSTKAMLLTARRRRCRCGRHGSATVAATSTP